MNASHDDRLSSLAKFCSDLISARGITGKHGEADHVTGKIEVDIMNRFIDQTDFPIGRRIGRNGWQAQLRKPYCASFRRSQSIGVIAWIRIDQQQPLARCVLDHWRLPNELTVPRRLNKLHES